MGYLGEPQATRAVLTSDGWLKSGDLGFISEVGVATSLVRWVYCKSHFLMVLYFSELESPPNLMSIKFGEQR